jgi:hypothetical protein
MLTKTRVELQIGLNPTPQAPVLLYITALHVPYLVTESQKISIAPRLANTT